MKKKILIALLVIVMFLVIAMILYKMDLFKINEKDKVDDINDITEEEISKDLFENFYTKAEEKMRNMSIEEKIGQMFLARCPSDETAISEISSLKPGGYVLFGRDFTNKTKTQVINTITSYQNASKIPMLIAVDEEGGKVVRVSSNRNLSPYTFKSSQDLYSEGGYDAIKLDAEEKAKVLLGLGINLNLAPVADVSTNPDDYIYARSFGKNANDTAEYAKYVVEVCNNLNLGTTLKHFPGYGSNTDTHADISIDKKTKSQFENSDLIPFRQGIESGVPSILVSHNIVECYDKDLPSSLSKPVHDLLRNDLGFTGVIITDDLSMKAITNYTDGKNAAVLAVNAGNDMLISSELESDRNAILEAVKNGSIEEETINKAVKRILSWKYYMGLIK